MSKNSRPSESFRLRADRGLQHLAESKIRAKRGKEFVEVKASALVGIRISKHGLEFGLWRG